MHAALRLPADALAVDMVGAVRSGVGALVAAAESAVPTMAVLADIRTGLPGSADERDGGDGAAAFVFGAGADMPVLAEIIGQGSATAEFLDRWRAPGAAASRVWEERFGEQAYGPLAEAAMADALKQAGLTPGQVDHLIVAGLHARAVSRTIRAAGVPAEAVADNLVASIGNAGTAQPGILLADVLDRAGPDETVLLVVLADGATAFALRTTDGPGQPPPAAAGRRADRGGQHRARATPPSCPGAGSWTASRRAGRTRTRSRRRPRSAGRTGSSGSSRRSAPGAARAACRRTGSASNATRWTRWLPEPLADVPATVATYTVDRLAYTPSPPMLMVVLDFDGGGRMRCQLTDAAEDEVRIGLPGRDDVPAADHRRRRAQLLLEGSAVSASGRDE